MAQRKVSRRAVQAAVRQGLCMEELRKWMETQTGGFVSAAACVQILRDALPKETFYQTEVMSCLKAAYPQADVWKEAAGPYSQKGRPDVSAIVNGRFFGFEVKRPYIGVLSEIQAATIKKIRRAGGTAEVVSFGSEAVRIVAAAMGGADRG